MKKQGVPIYYQALFNPFRLFLYNNITYRSEQKPKSGANKSPRSSCLISPPRKKQKNAKKLNLSLYKPLCFCKKYDIIF